MKKVILSLAGVLATGAFAPEASAIPAFARQTGMACNACHFQHFPTLNSFGRAFKVSGFTMMGAQGKVEDEHLSLPGTLNATVFINAQYQKTNGPTTGATASTKNSNNGVYDVPNAMSLFLGGRIAENAGFIGEVGLLSPAGLAAFKMPFMFDVGGAKVGVIPFTSDSLGVAHSFELMNTGAVAVHAFNQADISAMSAQAYINTTGAAGTIANPTVGGAASNAVGSASGLAFVASNDMGFINVAKWTPSHIGAGTNGAPTSNYVRAAWLGNVSGWDAGIGIQSWSGTSTQTTVPTNGVAAFNGVPVDTKASAIDAQMLGEVSGMPLTVVASYARAPVSSGAAGTNLNLFNTNVSLAGAGGDRTSFNIAAELGVIPHKATLQAAIRRAKSGANALNAAGLTIANTNATDNAIMLGASYELAQNLKFVLTHSMYSGDAYNAGVAAAAVTAGTPNAYTGDRSTWLQMESAF